MEKKDGAAEAATQVPALISGNLGSSLSLYLDKDKMNQLYKVADMFAKSDIIPKQFQDKVGNCFIALEMASNMGVSPIFLMQNLAIVNGKPAIEAKLVTAMINNSGRFVDPLEYEIVGTDGSWDKTGNGGKGAPADPKYKVRCFAVLKKTGKTLYGPWVSWDMAMGEGWVSKTGSKWQTMPEMMFMYRAASYFSKQYCSDLSFGMQTQDEMRDVIDITPGGGGRAGSRVDRAKTILDGFDDPAPSGENTAAGDDPGAAGDPGEAGCDHPYEAVVEVEGVNTCSICGEVIPEGFFDPSPEEQERIRQEEMEQAGKEKNLFS